MHLAYQRHHQTSMVNSSNVELILKWKIHQTLVQNLADVI
jgi:hypothetical protein